MTRLRAVLAIAILMPLAGCLSSDPTGSGGGTGADDIDPSSWEPLTETVYEIGDFETYRLESYDGTILHVDVQFPDGDGPWPLIIEYTPYMDFGTSDLNAFLIEMGQEGTISGTASRYIPYGYAVATAHVRGTGNSGGCLTVGGPEEGLDGVEIVEQLAAMPWSNGKVAMTGASYVGTTPLETAVHNPPHLTTIIPVAAVTEWYRYYYELGLHRWSAETPPFWDFTDPIFWITLGTVPGWRTGTTDPSAPVCPTQFAVEYWGNDDYNAYWQDRNHGAQAANSTVPMLYSHGFDDPNVGTNMIPAWWYEHGGEKRAWMGQHGHGYPSSQLYREYEHRWLDYWLLGRDNGALHLPTAIIQDSDGMYRAEDAWPAEDIAMMRFWPEAGGLHMDEPSSGSNPQWFDASPSDADLGIPFQPTQLSWTSEPLEAGLILMGEPVMHLSASSNLPDTQFGVRLFDVAEDGSELLITRGYLDARHRDGLESGQDLTPGTKYGFEWVLHPQDYDLPAGHRIRLALDSGDRYVAPSAVKATNTAYLGSQGPTWIDIPVVPMDSREVFEEAADVAPYFFRTDDGDA